MKHLLLPLVLGLVQLAMGMAMNPAPFDAAMNADIMKALLDALYRHDIEPKDAMDRLRYDKSQWSRICQSQLPAPSITRICSAFPWPVLADFIPELSKVIAKHKLQGIADAVDLRRSA